MQLNQEQLRELDAWIAFHVFGDRPQDGKSIPFSSEQYCHPRYTTDAAAAMEVLRKCNERLGGTMVQIGTLGGEVCIHCSIFDEYFTKAETHELALCLFAKKLFHNE